MSGLEATRLRASLKAKLFGEPSRPLLVGRFEILEKIAEGGMGVVYRARDPALDRVVALKVLHAGGENAQLLTEARAMARLDHPNVVGVFEVGTSEDRVFLAMEYVDGTTLDGWLSAAPRTPRQIASAFASAARGLAAAHRVGLVHRDFKPQNVLVSKAGDLRVADFGLARAATREEGAPLSSGGPLSRTRLAGTPVYMAPELFEGASPDPMTDQFSFAATLFEALHGRKPFEGKTIEELRAAHGRSPSAPTGGRNVTRAMRRAALRGLSRDRAQRFPSMDAFADELLRGRVNAWIYVAVAVLFMLGAVGVAALGSTWKTPAKRKKSSASTSARSFVAQSAPPAPPSLEASAVLPPAPKVDWSKRTVPEYSLDRFQAKVREAGYEIVRVEDASTPDVNALYYLTVRKAPCAGAANYVAYKEAKLADHSERALRGYGSSRVVRSGARLIEVNLTRVDTVGGDPACTDPLALALTE